MSKLANLNFYSKLYDLFDANKPKDVPAKIQEVIRYIRKSLMEYESENGHQDEIHQRIETLKDLQRAFENALTIDSGWGFCITNAHKKHQINLRPIYNFLHDNPMFIAEMKELTSFLQSELLMEGSVAEFKTASYILREIITVLDGNFAETW